LHKPGCHLPLASNLQTALHRIEWLHDARIIADRGLLADSQNRQRDAEKRGSFPMIIQQSEGMDDLPYGGQLSFFQIIFFIILAVFNDDHSPVTALNRL
jgi:hypothetical protein